MSSSSWASKRQSRENWAEEVIAAAMKTGSEEGIKSLHFTSYLPISDAASIVGGQVGL